MTSARTLLTGRRAWLTAGSLSLVLVGGLTQELLPSPAEAAAPRLVANSADAPTVVEPSTQAAAPAAQAAPAAAPAPASPAPVAKPAKPAAPAAPAKPAAAPKKNKAAPSATDVCSGPGWQQKRGSRALASLRHGTPAGVTVAFKGARSGYLGLTYPDRGHIDMFIRPCSSQSWSLLRHVMAHEMGHAYDGRYMTAASRAAYMAMRGIPASTPWFGCSYCTDFATPAGDFAEVYAQWQRGASTNRSQMAAAPGPAALARIASVFFTR